MKKMKLLGVIAVAGLLGLSARASVSGVDSVKVKLTVLTQTNETETSSAIKFNVNKLKVTTKDVLNQIADEYDTTFPDGAILALDGLFGGDFSVLDKDGNVLVADANVSPEGVTDQYELSLETENEVFTGKETESAESFKETVITDFFYENATDSTELQMFGIATASGKENFDSETFSESFKFSGAEDGFVNDADAVVSGTVSGSGKNLED